MLVFAVVIVNGQRPLNAQGAYVIAAQLVELPIELRIAKPVINR